MSLIPLLGILICSLLESTRATERGRSDLANQWAPIFFHDEAAEFLNSESGFNPVDTPLSFFFDDNENLRDNGVNAFRLTHHQEVTLSQEVPIYFSLIESRSHYYLNYIVYHAVDAKADGYQHVHDTENVLVIVEKSPTGAGTLVGVISNAHGFGMAYSPSEARQEIWRTRLESHGIGKSFLNAIDPQGDQQDKVPGFELIHRSKSVSPSFFVSARSHAIYKFSTQNWRQSETSGSGYFPRSCRECTEALDSELSKSLRRWTAYELIDLDLVLSSAASQNENFWVGKNRKKSLSSFYQERSLPGFLAPGWTEAEGKVNLFYRATFKTGIPLSDPARLHQSLESDAAGISSEYLYNPFIERKSHQTTLLMSESQKKSKDPSLLFLADQFLHRLNFY